jgi:hypothetical protein
MTKSLCQCCRAVDLIHLPHKLIADYKHSKNSRLVRTDRCPPTREHFQLPTRDTATLRYGVPIARLRGERGDKPSEIFQTILQSPPISRVQLFDGSCPYMVDKHKDVCDVLTDLCLSKVRPARLSRYFCSILRFSTEKERQRNGFPEILAGAKAAAKTPLTFVDMDPPAHGHQRFV